MNPVAVVETVRVVRSVPWIRLIIVMALALTIMWRYFVYPAIDNITPWEGITPSVPDLTPWDGIIPGSFACGGVAPAADVPKPSGFPALWHDVGTGLRSLADGPPSPERMVGWFRTTGEATARSVSYVQNGLEGQAIPIPLAPPTAPMPTQQVALSDAQVAQLAVAAGWPQSEIPNVVARVRAESSGDPRAQDYADGTHHGLLQLGTAERARYIPGQDAFDPLTNLKGARALWQERGWQPWQASDAAVKTVAIAPAAGCAAPAAPEGRWVNGSMPDSALVPMPGGQKLRSDAAAAFHGLSAAYAQRFGAPLTVGSGYRTYAQQASLKIKKPGLAARAGKSQHGLGLAADINGPGARFGTAEHEWLRVNAEAFGWTHPSWARRDGSKPEPWHWEYVGAGVTMAAG